MGREGGLGWRTNKENMGGSCFLSCQIQIRMLCDSAMCHSRKKELRFRGINYIILKYT